jgi:hypothetical protein
MTTNLTRNSVAYVLDQPGNKPNRIRAWPQKPPELPEGPIIGKAPEWSALLVLNIKQLSVKIGSTTKTFPNPHTDPAGRVRGYVRAFDGDRKIVVEGWTAENEDATIYLEPLGAIESCNAATADAPGMRWRPSNLKADMQVYVVSKTALNVRAGPGCNTADVGDLAPGTVIKVLEGPRCSVDGRVWWRIKLSGKDRWVCEHEPAGTSCGSTPAGADLNQIDWNLLPLRAALPTASTV